MNGARLTARVAAVVLEVHRRNGGRLTSLDPSLRLLEPVLAIDSLDLAEIMAVLEREFGVSPFEQAAPRTWAEVAAALARAGAGGAEGIRGGANLPGTPS